MIKSILFKNYKTCGKVVLACLVLVLLITVANGLAQKIEAKSEKPPHRSLNTDYVKVVVTYHVNQAPVVSDIPDQTIAEGATFTTISLDDYVSDVDNADAEMAWTYRGNTKLTVTITDRVATIGIPNADWNGSETITFTATDLGALLASDAATFTVTAVNDAPVLSPIGNKEVTVGQPLTFIISAFDPDGDPLTYSVTELEGATINAATGVFSWTPSAEQTGPHSGIIFTATDPTNLSDSETIKISVLSAPPPSEEPIFKEFFFTFNDPSNKDSIGLRIYPNTKHLSLMEWYKDQVQEGIISPGAPMSWKVGPYEAMQEGRTYYINGVNLSGSYLYSNVYVFSFSDNPTAETLNIVNQLLANFALNVNINDKEETKAIYRDFKRIQDFQLIANKLWDYYRGNQSYPKLTENPELGTYLPSYTNSKWRSWQGVLGNLLRYTLPVDPQNGFYGCGSSTLTIGSPEQSLGNFDATTCWNAASSTFACPAGSQVYQYETKGGASSTLKAEFERPTSYTWVESLDSTKPVDLAGTLTYQTDNTCNDTVYGIGGKCGDGIVDTTIDPDTYQPKEACEIGQTRSESCDASGYPGLKFYSCNNTCSGWTVARLICDLVDDSVDGELGPANAGGTITVSKVVSDQGILFDIITENAPCGAWDHSATDSRWACGNASWEYESFDFPAAGDYGAYVITSNTQDLSASTLSGDKYCPAPGIQHHLVFYLDGIKVTGEVCNNAVPTLQTSWVSLGDVSKGRHTLKIEWDNDWTYDYPDGVWGSADDRDSNVEIYKVGIGRGCHEAMPAGRLPICIPQGKCGDGKIQSPTSDPSGPEQCDDGKNNGKYGYCNTTCTDRHPEYCGNIKLDTGKEMCDAAALCWNNSSFRWFYSSPPCADSKGWCSSNHERACSVDSDCIAVCLPSVIPCPTGICLRSGAKYNKDRIQSCSWDCQSFDYCGDGRRNTDYEECDKESESRCQVGVCATGSGKVNQYCQENADCGSGTSDVCQNRQPGKKYCRVPNEFEWTRVKICQGGDKAGKECQSDFDCPPSGTRCSNAASEAYTAFKDDAINKYPSPSDCQWDIPSGFNRAAATVTCLPLVAPAPVYSPTKCGNGIIDVGEVCDAGTLNGQVCTFVGQANTCTYCAYGCQQVMTVSK